MRFPRRALFAWLVSMTWSCGGGYGGGNPNGPSAGPPAGASTITILGQRGSQSFTPNPAAPPSNKLLTWRNTDNTTHRIVANDGSFDTGNVGPGTYSGAVQLAADGSNYHCSIHPTMVGSINSSTGTPPPCTGPYCP